MSGKNKKYAILIDTCVWLDIAKDPASEPILTAFRDLVGSGYVTIYLPDLVSDEFERNKDKVIDVSRQRLTQEFRRVKGAIDKFGSPDKENIIGALDEVSHKLPMLTDSIFITIEQISEIHKVSEHLEISAETKVNCAERALNKKAPFHKGKNSMADAFLIYQLSEQTKSNYYDEYIFVTHNVKDFSSPQDNRKPHEDFEEIFESGVVKYFISVVDALKSIDEEILEDYIAEHEWVDESRGLYEIVDEIDILIDKIWYNRHCVREQAIADGRIKLVPKEDYKDYSLGTIRSDIWEGALASAEKTRKKYPGELGPFDDFEWGMLNGKLSALRWVIGYEWDMLDT